MRRRALGAGVVLALLGASGGTCEEHAPVVSTDVSTRDLDLTLGVEADASAVLLTILLVGPGGPVRLTGGERLVAEGGGAIVELSPIGGGTYEASFDADVEWLDVHLARRAPGEPARLSIVVPRTIDLYAPAAFSRAEGLTLRWTPQEGIERVILSLRGDCLRGIDRSLVGDPGEHSFQPADFEASDETCAASVSVARRALVQAPTILRSAAGEVRREAIAALESRP